MAWIWPFYETHTLDLARNQQMLKVSTALKKIGPYRMREGKYGEIVLCHPCDTLEELTPFHMLQHVENR